TLPPEARPERLAAARAAQAALVEESLPWTRPLAEMVKAAAARASGDKAGAEAALREASKLADAVEMRLHAAAARRQLGRLVGGEGGQVLVKEAEETMRSRGVRNPERYAGMLLP